jgi:hypothetical protein
LNITWKLISWISTNPTFRGWKVFPEFPNKTLLGYCAASSAHPNFGNDGIDAPPQAGFPPSFTTGPAHRFKHAFNLGHNGAIVPCRADFFLRSW